MICALTRRRGSAHETHLALCLLLLAALGGATARAQEATTEAGRNPVQMSLAHQHADFYKGGQSVAVTVYINATQWDSLTAMGLYETVPTGWSYGGIREVSGDLPGVLPASGATGVLQFLWINQPRSPVAFQYVLNVPARDAGVRLLSGQVEYRLGEGAQTSNVALSQLEGEADALPVIALRGAAVITVPLNAPFADPGATATDAEDGDLTGRIQVVGQVDTSTPGSYPLIYGVIDNAGNHAEPVTRDVVVSESSEEPAPTTPSQPDPQSGSGDAIPDDRNVDSRGKRAMAASQTAPDNRHNLAISIPDVTLRPPPGDFNPPLNSDQTGAGSAETGRGEGDSDSEFRSASAVGESIALGGSRRDAAAGTPLDDASALSGEHAGTGSSPLILIVATALLVLVLPVAWYRRGRPGRRRP